MNSNSNLRECACNEPEICLRRNDDRFVNHGKNYKKQKQIPNVSINPILVSILGDSKTYTEWRKKKADEINDIIEKQKKQKETNIISLDKIFEPTELEEIKNTPDLWFKKNSEELADIKEKIANGFNEKTFTNFEHLSDYFCNHEEQKEQKEQKECILLKDELLIWAYPGTEDLDLLEWHYEEKRKIIMKHVESCEFCQIQLPKKIQRCEN